MRFVTNPFIAKRAGFSLVELLVVVAVIGLLAALTVPAVVGSLSATRLSTGGQAVLDTLNKARQTAVSRNATVEVRWFKYADSAGGDPEPRFRALQAYVINSGTATPLDRGLELPAGIRLAEDAALSPFLFSTNHAEIPVPEGTRTPGRGSDKHYRAFRFSPRGSADLSPSENYVTLIADRSPAGSTNANFVTVQVQPISGGVREFRP